MGGGVFAKKRPRITVQVAWFSLWPARGRDMAFWAAVGRRVKQRRVRNADRAAIRRICAEVDAFLSANEARVSGRRAFQAVRQDDACSGRFMGRETE